MSLLLCKFCQSKFMKKATLINHQKNAKYCKKIQETVTNDVNDSENLKNIKDQLQTRDLYIQHLEEKIEKLKGVRVLQPNHPIDIGDGKSLISCDEKAYLDVTRICKAGGKKISSWRRLKKSQMVIEYLSRDLEIPIQELICHKNKTTYAHPRVAINIAQWISPEFDVKVSKWIYEIILTGSFAIQKEKTNLELEKLAAQNLIYAKKIDSLEKKLLEKRERVNYPSNTIYLVSTQNREKNGEFKIGKASNLKNRLSTLNTSEEHTVYFYLACKNTKEMNILEKIIHNQLEPQRITPNREWFRGSVKFFTDIIEAAARKLAN